MAVEAKSSSFKEMVTKELSMLTRPSRVYIVEHFVALILLALLIVSGVGLFNSLIDHFMDEPALSYDYGYYVTPDVETLAMSIATAMVAGPGFVLAYVRSRKAERAHKELLSNRARRRLEYAWMSIASLFVLGYVIAFMYTTVLKVIDFEVVTSQSWPQAVLKQLFAVAFITLGVAMVARMTPGLPSKGAK